MVLATGSCWGSVLRAVGAVKNKPEGSKPPKLNDILTCATYWNEKGRALKEPQEAIDSSVFT